MATFTTRPWASSKTHGSNHSSSLNETANLVHDDWEHLDPTPDVTVMFRRFDDKFFEGKLKCVEVEWSKKMFNCAGICYLRQNAFGRSIIIRLSEPLLKLRPRKDLVQTLLHEMIHAIAFVLGIREGNGGHGPFFNKKKDEINRVAGTNITVYHTFHDEVNEYKKHIWRCNGICRERKPFFGYVRRAMNRAPGPSDNWWANHQNICGGRFEKVAEPEKPTKTKQPRATKAKEPVKNQPSIRNIFPSTNPLPNPPPRGPCPASRDPSFDHVPAVPPRSSNFRSFGEIRDKEPSRSGAMGAVVPVMARTPSEDYLFKGVGNLLNTIRGSSGSSDADVYRSIQEQVRYIWANRAGGSVSSQAPPTSAPPRAIQGAPTAKRPRNQETVVSEPTRENQWQLVDDDIAIRTPYVPVVDLLDSDSDPETESRLEAAIRRSDEVTRDLGNRTTQERQQLIREEIFESEDEDEITMIDDEFDDTIAGAFGGSRGQMEPTYSENEMAVCPICEGAVSRGYLAEHMEEACAIRNPVNFVLNPGTRNAVEGRSTFSTGSTRVPSRRPAADPQRANVLETHETAKFPCPNCNQEFVGITKLNDHLDLCLS